MIRPRSVFLSVSMILAAALVLAACSPAAAPLATPTEAARQGFFGRTRTPGAGAFPGASPSATPAPSPTPEASATPQPTATVAAPPAHLSGRVAFVQGSLIWSLDLATGQKVQLTPQKGIYSHPAWSPSGQWLAFLDGTQLWAVGADGKDFGALVRDVTVHAFAWSPVKDELVYVTGDAQLGWGTVGQDAFSPAALITGKSGPVSGVGVTGLPYWSPDGKEVAVAVSRLAGSTGPQYAALWTVAPATNAVPVAAYSAGDPPSYGVTLAGWMPDGKGLLYWPVPAFSSSLAADGQELSVAPLSGAPGRVMQVGATLELPGAWSGTQGGTYLAAMVGYGRAVWAGKSIQVVSLADDTRATVSAAGQSASAPSFAPDGKWLAYVAGSDLGSGVTNPSLAQLERHLWIVGADGSGGRALTADAGYNDGPAAWTPEGGILFPRMDLSGNASLWTIWPWEAGRAPQKLVDGLKLAGGPLGYYGSLDWSALFSYWPGAPAQS